MPDLLNVAEPICDAESDLPFQERREPSPMKDVVLFVELEGAESHVNW